MSSTNQTLLDRVQEDSELNPSEKETIFRWAKDQSEVHVYSEMASVCRRLLQLPHFNREAYRVNISSEDVWGRHVDAAAYSQGTITGVRGTIPLGGLLVKASPRNTGSHADVVSRYTTNQSQSTPSQSAPSQSTTASEWEFGVSSDTSKKKSPF